MKSPCIAAAAAAALAALALRGATVVDARSFGARPGSADPAATSAALQAALNVAKTNGAPLVVKVVKGTYLLDRSLHIFPNTKLSADPAAVFVRTNSQDRTMLMGVHLAADGSECPKDDSCMHAHYGQVVNVTVEGGVWDAAATERDAVGIMHLCHGSNVTVRAATFRRATDHMLNLSGTFDSLVDGCTFKDAVRYTGSDPDYWSGGPVGSEERYGTIECVHLDATSADGEAGNYPEDGTTCRGTVVRGCLFDGVFAGVGNHHVGKLQAGDLDVVDCAFTNILSCGVMAFGFDGVRVSGCDMVGGQRLVWGSASRGIAVEDCSVAESSLQPVSFTQCTGTRVASCEFDSPADHAIVVDGGDATVVGNHVSDGEKFGLYLVGGADASASGNSFYGVAGYGFCAAEGSRLDACGNEVYGAGKAAYYFVDAADGSRVSGCAAYESGTSGVQAQRSPVEVVGCLVDGTASHGIVLMDCKGARVSHCIVLGAREHGVCCAGGSAEIFDSEITCAGGHGIYLSLGASARAERNVVESSGRSGVCMLQAEDVVLDDNDICGATNHCVYAVSSTNVTVTGNLLSDAGNCGVRLDAVCEADVAWNLVSGTVQHGLWLTGPQDVDVDGNVVESVKMRGILVTASQNTRISRNTLRGVAELGIYVDAGDDEIASASISDNFVNASGRFDIRVGDGCDGVDLVGNVCVGQGGESVAQGAKNVKWECGALTSAVLLLKCGGDGGDDIFEPVVATVTPPTRDGWTFEGYFTEPFGQGEKVFDAAGEMASADANSMQQAFGQMMFLYASWSRGAQMVQLDLDATGGAVLGAAGPTTTMLVMRGEALGRVPEAQREGYTLAGWRTAASGGDEVDGSFVVESPMTIFADWTPNSYSISYDVGEGVNAQSNPETYATDELVVLDPPTREGYEFLGWREGCRVRRGESAALRFTAEWAEIPAYQDPDPDPEPGTDPDPTPWTDPDPVPGTDPDPVPGTDPDPADPVPGTNPDPVPGTNPDPVPGTDPDPVPGTDPDPVPGTDPEPEIDPVVRPVLFETFEPISDPAAVFQAATIWDGWLESDGEVLGTIQAKVAKLTARGAPKVTVSVVEGGRKIGGRGQMEIGADGSASVSCALKDGRTVHLAFGQDALYGTLPGAEIRGARTIFTSRRADDKQASEAVLARLQRTAVVYWNGNALSVVVAKKGKCKVSGSLSSGARVSASSQLVAGEAWCAVPVVYAKRGADVRFLLWMNRVTGEVVVEGLGEGAKVQWATVPGETLRFRLEGEFDIPGATVLTQFLPSDEGLAFSGGKKWILPKGGAVKLDRASGEYVDTKPGTGNPSGLKLTYNQKTGAFKGSFKVHAVVNGRLKKFSASVAGIMVGDVGYGTATIKKFPGVEISIR